MAGRDGPGHATRDVCAHSPLPPMTSSAADGGYVCACTQGAPLSFVCADTCTWLQGPPPSSVPLALWLSWTGEERMLVRPSWQAGACVLVQPVLQPHRMCPLAGCVCGWEPSGVGEASAAHAPLFDDADHAARVAEEAEEAAGAARARELAQVRLEA